MKPQESNNRDPLDSFPKVARFRFHMRALEPIVLPAYAGSAWRGILGHGLRRVTCVTRQPECGGCLLVHNCVYSTFFESPACATAGSPGRYTHLPHPFVLEPDVDAPRAVCEGDQLCLGIALIGPAREQVPYLIHGVDKAGERGLGRQGGRFVLDRVECERRLGAGCWEPVYAKETGEFRRSEPAPPVIPPPPPALRVELTTPLRIKRHGHFVGPREFAATDLLRHLLARLANLAEFYGGDPAAFDWQRLRHHADGVQHRDLRLYWRDWTRYSSRQDTRMQMGGLLGNLTLAGHGIPAFWLALWLGQWFRVGKGTSFGLGRYRLDPLRHADLFRAPPTTATLPDDTDSREPGTMNPYAGGARGGAPRRQGCPGLLRRTRNSSGSGRIQSMETAAMTDPADYPRRILLAVTGLSPQVVTETLFALAIERPSPFVPTEMHLVTTGEGAERARLSLLSTEPGWLARFLRDYELPAIAFGADYIHVLQNGEGATLDDIRTPADNERAADDITERVRQLTADPDSALHVSIAGGRKTMGYYLGYALSLFGRPQIGFPMCWWLNPSSPPGISSTRLPTAV